ncbi:MAG: aminodeoxychorismate/anthranilate synthase component II [Bacteroidota bacterium]
MKKILIIDNYDSFTFNLLHLVEQFDDIEATVKRNNAFELDELVDYNGIIFSPGPGLPRDAGKMMDVIDKYHSSIPILGICLGMQAIGEYFGAELVNMAMVQHGVMTKIDILENNYLFTEIPNTIDVGRYHSWAFTCNSLPNTLIETASDGEYTMALRHKTFPIMGVQFHPESIMTNYGYKIIGNWIKLIN